MAEIPQRYKDMGFTKVGQKKKSTREGKKWQVLAKKGDQYKVVHGGDSNMEDFSQHGSEKRKKAFWDRMGGKDSAKANDPFSPLYWHKKLGKWEDGGPVGYDEDLLALLQDGGTIKTQKNRHVTKLTPKEEKEFRSWYNKVAYYKELDPNPDSAGQYYDYRGFWKNEDKDIILTDDPEAHFYDTYKTPGHPTFSNESKYSTDKTPGGSWTVSKDGTYFFTHSPFTEKYVNRTTEYLKGTGENSIFKGDTIYSNPRLLLRRESGGPVGYDEDLLEVLGMFQDGGPVRMDPLVDQLITHFDNQRYNPLAPIPEIELKDTRKVRGTTGKPINPNKDLLSGKYSQEYIDRIIDASKDLGVDPNIALAVALQESKFGKTTPGNIGHILELNEKLGVDGDDDVYDFVTVLKNKMGEYADSLKIPKDNKELRIQAYNGYGKLKPETEQDYHGYKAKSFYGVEIPKEGLDMRKNPLYGKQILDLSENIIKKNEYIQNRINDNYQLGGLINTTGYTKGTTTENNPFNIIPSGDITMQDVDYDILAIPNNDKPTIMKKGKNYKFKNSDSVLEIPMRQMGGGIDFNNLLGQFNNIGVNTQGVNVDDPKQSMQNLMMALAASQMFMKGDNNIDLSSPLYMQYGGFTGDPTQLGAPNLNFTDLLGMAGLFNSLSNLQKGGEVTLNDIQTDGTKVPIQAEKGEMAAITGEDGLKTIFSVNAENSHEAKRKSGKKDVVTEFMEPGSYVFSKHKSTKMDLRNIVVDITKGTPYKEKIGKEGKKEEPKQITLSDALGLKEGQTKVTPAEAIKLVKKNYPYDEDIEEKGDPKDPYYTSALSMNKVLRSKLIDAIEFEAEKAKGIMPQMGIEDLIMAQYGVQVPRPSPFDLGYTPSYNGYYMPNSGSFLPQLPNFGSTALPTFNPLTAPLNLSQNYQQGADNAAAAPQGGSSAASGLNPGAIIGNILSWSRNNKTLKDLPKQNERAKADFANLFNQRKDATTQGALSGILGNLALDTNVDRLNVDDSYFRNINPEARQNLRSQDRLREASSLFSAISSNPRLSAQDKSQMRADIARQMFRASDTSGYLSDLDKREMGLQESRNLRNRDEQSGSNTERNLRNQQLSAIAQIASRQPLAINDIDFAALQNRTGLDANLAAQIYALNQKRNQDVAGTISSATPSGSDLLKILGLG